MSDEVSDDEIAASVRGAIAHMRAHPLDGHAQEIGRLCMLWGRLEMAVTILLDHLMDIPHRDTLNIIMGALDFRSKIQIAIPIAFSKKGNSAWFQKLQEELNSIDNDLRPERNRMIHDYWYEGTNGEEARRLQIGARVVKDQRDRILKLATVTPVSVDDLTQLCVRVARAIGAVDILSDELRGPRALPDIPGPPAPPADPVQD